MDLVLRAPTNEVAVPPTRKSKGKSRLGCKTCKSRRIKCDEGHPTCGRCISASRTCVYEATKIKDWQNCVRTFEVPKNLRPSAIPAFLPPAPILFQHDISKRKPIQHRNSATGHHPGRTIESGRPPSFYSAEDVQLLCHFISHTSQSLIDDPEIWTRDVVPLAFQYDFLMHGILTLSATHLQHLKPSELCYRYLSSYHLSHTLGSYSAALRQEKTSVSSDALIATSFLLLAQSSATPTFDPTKADEDTFLSLSAGIRTVAVRSLRNSSTTIFHNMMSGSLVLPAKPPIDGPGLDLMLMVQRASPDTDTSSCEFEALIEVVETLNPLLEITTRTIAALSSLTTPFKRSNTYKEFFERFASFLPPLFINLVHQYDVRALIIISYYYGCTGYFAGFLEEIRWWWKDRPFYMVTHIAGFVGGEWAPLMDWPLKVVRMRLGKEQKEERILVPTATITYSERDHSSFSIHGQQKPGFI